MGRPRSPARFGVAVRSTGGAYDWRYPQGLPAVNVSGAGVTDTVSAPAGSATVIPVVAPTLSAPAFVGTTATIAFSGGSGYTTLIPQYSTDGVTWTSAASDIVSPFNVQVPNPATLYYFRALPNNAVVYATNIVSGTTGAAANRAALAYFLDTEVLTVGAAAPSIFPYNGPTVTNARAYTGSKSIKVPITAGSFGAGWNTTSVNNYPIAGYSPKKGDTVWVSQRVWIPSSGVSWNGTPGFIKWMRFRMGTAAGGSDTGAGAVYTLLQPDGTILSDFEGFEGLPLSGGSIQLTMTASGKGPTLGAWSTIEHVIVLDTICVDAGGAGEQRYYMNGTQLFRRTNCQTLKSATDTLNGIAWIDYWNGGAPLSFETENDDLCMALYAPGTRDDRSFLVNDANGRLFIGM